MITAMQSTSTNERVGREIKAWMARLDVNQKQLSEALGQKQPQISQRLKGQIPFRIDELLDIADYMGVTLRQLLGDELVNERSPRPVGGGSFFVLDDGSGGGARSRDLTIMRSNGSGRTCDRGGAQPLISPLGAKLSIHNSTRHSLHWTHCVRSRALSIPAVRFPAAL